MDSTNRHMLKTKEFLPSQCAGDCPRAREAASAVLGAGASTASDEKILEKASALSEGLGAQSDAAHNASAHDSANSGCTWSGTHPVHHAGGGCRADGVEHVVLATHPGREGFKSGEHHANHAELVTEHGAVPTCCIEDSVDAQAPDLSGRVAHALVETVGSASHEPHEVGPARIVGEPLAPGPPEVRIVGVAKPGDLEVILISGARLVEAGAQHGRDHTRVNGESLGEALIAARGHGV